MNPVHAVREKPVEVTATDLRNNIARVLRDAEYGIPTVITRDRQPVAKVVHPDAGVTPGPDLWQAAQEAYDAITNAEYHQLPTSARRFVESTKTLLAAHYGYDQEAP